jgi:murein L,D-transpeptidase YcbB/YkuD
MRKIFSQSIIIFVTVIFSISPLSATWVESLGGIQSTHVARQSYMQGLLLGQTYGIYNVTDLHSKRVVQKFYEQRDFRTFWFNGMNEPDLSVVDMLDAIKKASSEGLDTSRYHLAEIDALFDEVQDGTFYTQKEYNLATITLDLMLTDAFLTLAHDLYEGLIDYNRFQAKLKRLSEARDINYAWDTPFPKMDYLKLLKQIKSNGEIKQTLYALVTQNPIYLNLLDAYEHYRIIVSDGGFVQIPNVALKIGSKGEAVKLLAQRLFQSDDLDFYDEEYMVFDKLLQQALKKFQKRMGLVQSGVLNRSTRRALNVPAHERLKIIKINLERSRWEKDPMNCNCVFVNIPAFMMYFLEGSEIVLQMPVVVGKKTNPTPIFKAYMSYVVLNPTWSVPQSIVKKEMLKRLQEDPDYLNTRNFKAYDGWSKNRKEIDPFEIDWYQYDEESDLPFSFVKQPGRGNPLGKVKFMFPNKYAVYMHDTNEKKLFKRRMRAFSHGCIRLQNPQKMLEFVSENFLDKPYEAVKALMNRGDKTSLNLSERIPVYIRYYTSWVNEDGVNFRSDIYGYDKIQSKLMH